MSNASTNSRLPLLEPENLDPAQAELYATIAGGPRAVDRSRSPITDERGRMVGPFNAMLFNPDVGSAMQALGAAIRYHTSFNDATREIAILAVAAELGSNFEKFAHEPLARAAGVSDEILEEIAKVRDPNGLSPREALVYRSTRALLNAADLDDVQFEELQAEVGTTACVELVALVGYYRMLDVLLRTFRVPIPSE